MPIAPANSSVGEMFLTADRRVFKVLGLIDAASGVVVSEYVTTRPVIHEADAANAVDPDPFAEALPNPALHEWVRVFKVGVTEYDQWYQTELTTLGERLVRQPGPPEGWF